MREVVIVDAIRTPVGKANKHGVFQNIRSDELGVLLINEILKRNDLSGEEVDELIIGCVNQSNTQNRNIARMVGLMSNLPTSVPAQTVNRACGSSLTATNTGTLSVMAGYNDVVIVGGIESMSHQPQGSNSFPHPNLELKFGTSSLTMGLTAENLAEKYNISRQEQDEYALKSHQKAVKAMENGIFEDEIIPVPLPTGEFVTKDQNPRPETTLEKLASLKPFFKENGSVTAGNSSGVNDGASMVLLMEKNFAINNGYKPRAEIISMGDAGVSPEIMGIGPVPSTKRALKRIGLSLKDIDLIELNEAFAAQVLAVQKELNLNLDKVNVNGGAIALGHALGNSGTRILTTLLYEMERRDVELGLATMCIGFGGGVTTVIKRI